MTGKIIDLKPALAERAERDLQWQIDVDRALLRNNILSQAIEAMRDEGSNDAEIALTLRWAAEELLK